MEKMVSANAVELCVETFGDQGDPAILLIHGASASLPGGVVGRILRESDISATGR
jgi:hypothetical protein